MLSRDSSEYKITFFDFLRSLQSVNLWSLLYFAHDVYGVNANIQKALSETI